VITLLNAKPQDLNSRKAYVALTQGMWAFESAYDTDNSIFVDKVDDATAAAYDKNKLGLVVYYPVERDGSESDYDSIAANTMVVWVSAPMVEVEDDKLASNSTTANWSSATMGTLMYVNTNGYLTLAGAADVPTSATAVAEFLKYENGIVFYRTL